MKSMFCGTDGKISNIRVMSFISLAVACFITIKGIFAVGVQADILIIWITAAFAPKVIQKFAEKGKGDNA